MSHLRETSEYWHLVDSRTTPASFCDYQGDGREPAKRCNVAGTYASSQQHLCTEHFELVVVKNFVQRYMAENNAVLVAEPEPERRFSCESWWLWPTQEGKHHCKDNAAMRFEVNHVPAYWFCAYHAFRIQTLFDGYVFQQPEITDPVFVLANSVFKHLEVAFA